MILEAMQLRVPVLARNIPGNAAVLTGLWPLFDTPDEFVRLASDLIARPEQHAAAVDRAFAHVSTHHSLDAERQAYKKVSESRGKDPHTHPHTHA